MQQSTYFLNLITILLKKFVKPFMLFAIINPLDGSKRKYQRLKRKRTQLNTFNKRECRIEIYSKTMKKGLTKKSFYIITQKIIYKTQFIRQKNGKPLLPSAFKKKLLSRLIMKMQNQFINMLILVLKNTSNKILAIYISRNIIQIL